ncbi:hypothetical protein LJR260_003646 [Variovorax paradoxus]|uniref:hypothetical protein n=1 Tax=Variovorax paradoxus TaxID=34073 RepID=UPI003ECE5A3F
MQYSFDVGAFIVAVIALGLTIWNSIRQSRLERDQDRLNKLMIAREERDAVEHDKAEFDVRIVTPGVGRYYLTINNVGRSTAHNVGLSPTKFGNAFTSQELESFPRSALGAGEQIELTFIRFMDATVENIHIVLTWTDAHGEPQKQDFYPSVPKVERQPERSPYALSRDRFPFK